MGWDAGSLISGGLVPLWAMTNTQSATMSIDFKSRLRILRNSAAMALAVVAIAGPPDAQAQTVTTSGDVLPNWNGLYVVGRVGAGSLDIADGGSVTTVGDAYLGYGGGVPGTVAVTGVNSLFGVGGALTVGRQGGSSLTVSGGGQVISAAANIALGYGITSTVLVTGAGSLWNNTGSMVIGGNQAFGFLTIENGGRVNSASARLGDGFFSAGTATVTGAGSLWANSGDLIIANNEEGKLTISDGGTVSVGTHAGGTSGVVRIAGDRFAVGTLNVGAASGATATAAGTLLASEIRFGRGTGTILFNHTGLPDGSDLQFGAALFGRGSIRHENGTTILTGDSSAFTGTTNVSGGRLIVANKLGGSAVVGNGATLGGSGTIGSGASSTVTLQSGATLAVGDSVGTLAVNGKLVVESGARYEVKVVPGSSQGDLVSITGAATLGGGTVAHIGVTGSYRPTATYTILSAAGGVTGAFTGVTSDFAFLDPELSYTAGSVLMKLTRNDITFGDVARTRNQTAVGGGLDQVGFGNPVYDAVVQLDEDAARGAFDSLSGEVHASAVGTLVDTSAQLRDAAGIRLRSAFGDVAAPDLPVMGYGEGGLELVAADTDRFVVWGQALGNWGSVDGNGNSGGFGHSSGGLIAGGDTTVGDGWRAGLLAGYSRTSFEADDGAASGNSDNFHLGVYGGRHFGAIALRAGAAYTRHSIDTTRTVSFPGLSETLKADYDAGTAQAFVEAGYRTELGRVAFEPFAGLAYVSTSTDGFTETGGAAALTSADKSFDSTTTTLGLRAATDVYLGDAKTVVRGGLGWRHAFGDVEPSSTVAFAGGDSFTVYGAPIARNALQIEAGFDLAVAPKATLGLTYTGQLANGARDHGAKATLAAKF